MGRKGPYIVSTKGSASLDHVTVGNFVAADILEQREITNGLST